MVASLQRVYVISIFVLFEEGLPTPAPLCIQCSTDGLHPLCPLAPGQIEVILNESKESGFLSRGKDENCKEGAVLPPRDRSSSIGSFYIIYLFFGFFKTGFL